jgi:serine/threonine-protein kinase
VGRGLAVMHGHNYIHRDLSPGNVRRTSRGTWVVMDPGFAKHLKRTSITGLFQPGTPGHMSPEHAAIGGRVTRASDVYCLGILAFQALTGNLPIPVGTDLTDYRRRLLAAQPETLGTLRPDLTSEQAHLVDTCLQRQPARRYLDGGELIDALQAIPGGPPR